MAHITPINTNRIFAFLKLSTFNTPGIKLITDIAINNIPIVFKVSHQNSTITKTDIQDSIEIETIMIKKSLFSFKSLNNITPFDLSPKCFLYGII